MRKLMMAAAALVALGASGLEAQDEIGERVATAAASIDIPQLLEIDVTGTNVTFPTPDVDDYTQGSVESAVQSVISTRGNIDHQVMIQSGSELMTGGSGNKLASDLRWSTDGSTYLGLTTKAEQVLANGAGDHPNTATVSYEMNLSDLVTDAPGTYTLDFTYTVIPQ